MKYYKKKNQSPNIYDIINIFEAKKLHFILIGSEAGQIYGLCTSTKDIDFLIENTEENITKLYLCLSEFYDLQDFDEFKTLEAYIIYPKEKKIIEIFKKPINPFVTYEEIQNKKIKTIFYGSTIDLIHISDYIHYIEKATKFYINKHQSYYKKYQNILDNYMTMIDPF